MQFTSLSAPWSTAKKVFFRFALLFTCAWIITVPFPLPWLPDTGQWLEPVFKTMAEWIGTGIFHLTGNRTYRLLSDATGLYIHALFLCIISLLAAITWTITDRQRQRSYDRWQYWFTVVVSYYLALQLLIYGFNKVFKWQFYLPEPNTLFTPIGQSYPDLLYWSTMGISREYSIFLGMLEVIAAILLLFKRSRVAGAVLAAGLLLNIVAVNFSFNISVKLHSAFLLWLSGLVLYQYAKPLAAFFSGDPGGKMIFIPAVRQQKGCSWAKLCVVLFLFASTLSVYWKARNWNDDTTARPPFHGAYNVVQFIRNNDTLPPLLTDEFRWRRVFVHRRNYLVVQWMNDEMEDYTFSSDTTAHEWHLNRTDKDPGYTFAYVQPNDSTLFLSGIVQEDTIQLQLDKIPWQQLPVLQKEFTWTIDE